MHTILKRLKKQYKNLKLCILCPKERRVPLEVSAPSTPKIRILNNRVTPKTIRMGTLRAATIQLLRMVLTRGTRITTWLDWSSKQRRRSQTLQIETRMTTLQHLVGAGRAKHKLWSRTAWVQFKIRPLSRMESVKPWESPKMELALMLWVDKEEDEIMPIRKCRASRSRAQLSTLTINSSSAINRTWTLVDRSPLISQTLILTTVMSIDIQCQARTWRLVALWQLYRTEMKSRKRRKVRAANQRSQRRRRAVNNQLTEKIKRASSPTNKPLLWFPRTPIKKFLGEVQTQVTKIHSHITCRVMDSRCQATQLRYLCLLLRWTATVAPSPLDNKCCFKDSI